MLNFSSDVDMPGASTTVSAPPAPIVDSVPVIQEQVTYRRPETRVTDIGKSPANWTWEDLRNYVVRSIESIHGPFPRDAVREGAIFRSFAGRWGNQAGPIAHFVFTELGGMWCGAPVGVHRFCKGADAYFAAPLAKRLSTVQ